MPNPYEDIFDDKNEETNKSQSSKPQDPSLDFDDDDRFNSVGKEPLEEILSNIQLFQKKAESFSRLLTKTSAIDDKVTNKVVRLFISGNKLHKKKNLKEERQYHDLLRKKFETIIIPMRSLAKIHLEIVKQFNNDIDKSYYSIEKTDRDVKSDISFAIDGLNIQRKILADAASDLDILKDALAENERRIKMYINAGGVNNISSAEFELITLKRSTLTDGRDHQFGYSFFDINILDKTVISLGIYMKETSSQYLGKLMKIFEIG